MPDCMACRSSVIWVNFLVGCMDIEFVFFKRCGGCVYWFGTRSFSSLWRFLGASRGEASPVTENSDDVPVGRLIEVGILGGLGLVLFWLMVSLGLVPFLWQSSPVFLVCPLEVWEVFLVLVTRLGWWLGCLACFFSGLGYWGCQVSSFFSVRFLLTCWVCYSWF